MVVGHRRLGSSHLQTRQLKQPYMLRTNDCERLAVAYARLHHRAAGLRRGLAHRGAGRRVVRSKEGWRPSQVPARAKPGVPTCARRASLGDCECAHKHNVWLTHNKHRAIACGLYIRDIVRRWASWPAHNQRNGVATYTLHNANPGRGAPLHCGWAERDRTRWLDITWGLAELVLCIDITVIGVVDTVVPLHNDRDRKSVV